MMSVEMIKLPVAVNQSDGPILQYPAHGTVRQLTVDYDYAGREWARLVFQDVLLFEWRAESVCRGVDAVSNTEMSCSDNSLMLSEAVKLWMRSRYRSEAQISSEDLRGGPSRFKHYAVWFDDSGTLHVVAGGFSATRSAEHESP
jgi:hypothetical protein